jgi:hypothetical protein
VATNSIFGAVGKERFIAAAWGILFTALLALLILLGSRTLQNFDAALVGYTFAVLFSTFAIVYRYAMWLQRPPTRMYWRRGWQVFFRRRWFGRNIVQWVKRVTLDFALNRFISNRDRLRGITHWLIMWGCLLAFAITFPLVFGWIHFETEPGRLDWYRTYAFGFPTFAFPIHSIVGFLTFHGLVWASFAVIIGVMLAMRRRMRDHGAAALQKFGEDFLPLILLFAISLTGLLLTASATWMKGYGYEFLALLHAVTVIFTLLWLPFGKFFHIFQRPAQLGVSFYKDIGPLEGMAKCARCGIEYASQMHVDDLIEVERQLGYDYGIPTTDNQQPTTHYQRVCPACRRSMLAIAQGALWNEPTTR